MTLYYRFADIYKGTPYYTTGTVTLTDDSDVLTGSGTSWSGTDISAGDMIIVDYETSKVPLFVSSVTNDTTIVMTSKWEKATASGLDYSIDNSDGSNNWFVRIFPKMRQHSGKTGSISFTLPLDGAPSNASVMPLQNSTKKYHVDGHIFIDSCTKSSVSTPDDVYDALEELADHLGILGFRWYNKNLSGGASNGVIISEWTIKDKFITRDYGSDKWNALLQIDLIPGVEF